jgi:hypothetical protein
MKNILFSLVAFSLAGIAAAQTQAPAIEWQKCLGGSNWDSASSIQQTSDGDYIVAGFTYSKDGDVSGNHDYYGYNGYLNDGWVVKLDTSGNLLWQKCLGGSLSDVTSSIQQTSDGGYIVAGKTNSYDGDVSGYHYGLFGRYDYWVVRLNPSGNLLWQKCLGGSGYGSSIEQTSDGGYIVAGSTNSNDGDVSGHQVDYDDIWVVKLAPDNLGTEKLSVNAKIDVY